MTVSYTLDAGVATITIDRPDSMNSLDTETKVALRDAALRAADDAEARATRSARASRS